jgi:hypothetical protein
MAGALQTSFRPLTDAQALRLGKRCRQADDHVFGRAARIEVGFLIRLPTRTAAANGLESPGLPPR